jgi:hypothetical protein
MLEKIFSVLFHPLQGLATKPILDCIDRVWLSPRRRQLPPQHLRKARVSFVCRALRHGSGLR